MGTRFDCVGSSYVKEDSTSHRESCRPRNEEQAVSGKYLILGRRFKVKSLYQRERTPIPTPTTTPNTVQSTTGGGGRGHGRDT